VIQAVSFKVQPATMRRIEQGFRTMPERMTAEFKTAFRDWGESWQGKMAERFRGAEGELHTRTGALKRSLDHQVRGSSAADLKLRLVSAGPSYARIQERGGVVRPVRAKFLAIPLEANKTAAGVARYPSPREFIAAHPGETFFLRTGSGKLLLMWKNPTQAARRSGGAKKGEAVPLWLLVRRVEIPGPDAPSKGGASRLGFFDTWRGMERERRVRMARIARAMGRFS
jgi:hypothetical protein